MEERRRFRLRNETGLIKDTKVSIIIDGKEVELPICGVELLPIGPMGYVQGKVTMIFERINTIFDGSIFLEGEERFPLPLRPTGDKPEKNGLYWYYGGGGCPHGWVNVSNSRAQSFDDSTIFDIYEDMPGEWLGPIMPPRDNF